MMMVTPADETLLLALLNTTPTVAGRRTDRLADPDQARAWLDRHGERQTARIGENVALLRATRDALQEVVRGRASPSDLAPALEGVSYRPVMRESTGGATVAWELAAPADHVLAARAVLAWDALEGSAPGRVRPCENTQGCSLFLIDHSKSNSARWCSMAVCGNRMKARRHYARQKEAGSAS